MVLFANCEEIKAMVVLSNNMISDSEVLFKFEIEEKEVHQAKSVESVEGFIEMSRQEHLVTENLLVNLEQLSNKESIKECVEKMLSDIGDNMLLFTTTSNLFDYESVVRLQEEISDQIFKLLISNGSTKQGKNNQIKVPIKFLNLHSYNSLEEYHCHVVEDESSSDDDEFEDEMEIDNQPKKMISASRASIDALERIKYKMEEWEEVTCCSVCWEEFMTGEVIRKMPCSKAHIFHTNCIEKWLKVNHTCPHCRYPMPTK
ncbi:hypothetical protein FRX31_028966 [Thalictrum thalictroides]|uniref:RING-type domain-containing protein n=1 Tax=Thalictrum thalictroides TaxID=46969 RepID=A0A7J6V9L4_THATH|nr:hypothetical protein FRX31_028966 [Thalictrum thalictroides]